MGSWADKAGSVAASRWFLACSVALFLGGFGLLIYFGWGVSEFGTVSSWGSAVGTLAAVIFALWQSHKAELRIESERVAANTQLEDERKAAEERLEREIYAAERRHRTELMAANSRATKQMREERATRDRERWVAAAVELISLHEQLLDGDTATATWGRARALLASLPPQYGRYLGQELGIPRDPWPQDIYPDQPDPRYHIAGEDLGLIDDRLAQIELEVNISQMMGGAPDLQHSFTAYASNLRRRDWKRGEKAAIEELRRNFPQR